MKKVAILWKLPNQWDKNIHDLQYASDECYYSYSLLLTFLNHVSWLAQNVLR